jgi:hypothetical protein
MTTAYFDLNVWTKKGCPYKRDEIQPKKSTQIAATSVKKRENSRNAIP